MHILLAGLGALVVGAGDFVGGTATRKDVPHAVATISFLTGTVFLAAMVPWFDGQASGQDYGWGAVSGLGGALGVFTLYRGFQRAPMGLVSPIAAVVGAAVPVIGGLTLGEEPSLAVTVGLGLGALAIVLVSLSPEDAHAAPGARRSAVAHGLVTGLGFGVLLMALALVDSDAGIGPLVVSRATSLTVLVAQGLVMKRVMWPARGVRLAAGAGGLLTSAGNMLYFLALGFGSIVVSTGVYALFPASTVVMARIFHDERLTRLQMGGVGLALCAAVLLGTGSI